MTSFEKIVREEIQMLQQEIRTARDYGQRIQMRVYDAQLQGYLMALRRCLSEKSYRTITEGLEGLVD